MSFATEAKRQRVDSGAPRACSRCAAPFHCGIDDPGGCWCAKLPPLPRAAYGDGGCLCERCLHEALGD